MKRYISYSIAIAMISSFLFSSCSKNEFMELDKGHDELILTADTAELVLEEVNHASNGIELSWTTGTNFGTGNKIFYTLEIDQAGSDFSSPYVAVDHEKQVYSWKKTVEQLNEILTDKMGIREESTVRLQARLTANVPECEEVQQVVSEMTVKTYKPVTETLFIIGDATPGGWSLEHAVAMNRTNNGIFTWTGNLKKGDFKFVVSNKEFIPSYGKDVEGYLAYRETEDQPDTHFSVEKDHTYQVNVNLLTRKISIMESRGEIPAYEKLYFIGESTDWSSVEMSRDPLDKFLFRIGRVFPTDKGGQFKFAVTSDDSRFNDMYKAKNPDAPYTDQAAVFVKGFEPDNKWVLKDEEKGKAYKICFDIRAGRERMMMVPFVPYEMIWMVGSAAPCGWNLGDATPMTKVSDYIFEWEGELESGELKFSCDKQSDWNGAWFMAQEAGEPTGQVEKMLFINKSDDAFKEQYLETQVGGVDIKWTIANVGNYKITLNQLEETVSILKK